MTEATDKPENWRTRAVKDLRSPMVAIGLAVSLITTIPTVYGWLFPGESTLVLVHYDAFTVYDPGHPFGARTSIISPPGAEFHPIKPTVLPDPPVRISTLDGEEIKGRVLDLEITIWNAGTEPVGRDKLRRPIIMTLPADALLGIRTIHENKDDGLKVVDLHTTPASVEVTWDYMDPKRGFRIAVVFAETRALKPLDISSHIAGRLVDTNKELPNLSWRNTITSGGLILILVLGSLAVFGSFRRGIAIIAPVIVVVMVIIEYWVIASDKPPF